MCPLLSPAAKQVKCEAGTFATSLRLGQLPILVQASSSCRPACHACPARTEAQQVAGRLPVWCVAQPGIITCRHCCAGAAGRGAVAAQHAGQLAPRIRERTCLPACLRNQLPQLHILSMLSLRSTMPPVLPCPMPPAVGPAGGCAAARRASRAGLVHARPVVAPPGHAATPRAAPARWLPHGG